METEKRKNIFYEWRIENFSHWCGEVHGDFIQSPNFYFPRSSMQLYPKGIGGQGQHLVVRLCGIWYPFSGELSFCSSDGSLLYKQLVNTGKKKPVVDLPPGPKFEDVLSRIIREDFITVSWRIKDERCYERYTRTVINVFKISLKIKPIWIEKKSEGAQPICEFNFSPEYLLDIMKIISTCSKNDIVHFMINPPKEFEYPFAVEMCLSVTTSDDTVDSCVKKEHVFHNNSSWTFPDPLQKKELIGKGISIFLCLKTRNMIQNYNCTNCDYRNVSIELNNSPFSSGKPPATDPVTSDKVSVLPKDSGSQTSHTSDISDDPVLVLSKELMCLYQDQKFSDITLKCDNVTFPVHKNILCARSPVFDRMLSSDMKEAASSEVDIEDLDPCTLSLFLTYLYTGAVEEELQSDRALKLYYAADKYQVPSLKKECVKFLCDNVSISNVCDILSLADRHNDDQLTSAAHAFILDNYNAVLRSKEWATLKKNEPFLAVDTVTQFAVEGRVRKHHPQ